MNTQIITEHFLSNSPEQWAWSAVIFSVVLVVAWLLKMVILVYLTELCKKTKTKFDDALVRTVDKLPLWFYGFIALSYALDPLTINTRLLTVIHAGITIMLVLGSLSAILHAVDFLLKKSLYRHEASERKQLTLLIKLFIKIVILTIGMLVVLSNLGVNTTAFIASLGIGGIAIALAIQNILSELFTAVAIFIDKPFKAGDYIAIGDFEGTVKQVGLHSTRIDALGGEEINVSNRDLVDSRIRNYDVRDRRRVSFKLHLDSSTSAEHIEKAIVIIEDIIKSEPEDAEIYKVWLKAIENEYYTIEAVYHLKNTDFDLYINNQHEVNIDVLKAFKKANIKLAKNQLYIKK